MVPKALERWKMVTSELVHWRGTTRLTSTVTNRLRIIGRCSMTGDYMSTPNQLLGEHVSKLLDQSQHNMTA